MRILFNRVRAYLFGVALFVLNSLSSAAILPVDFSLSDTDIVVGDTFDVDLSISFDSSLELAYLGFSVQPTDIAPGDGVLKLVSWQVEAPLEAGVLPAPSFVEAFGNPFSPLMGGTGIGIASLTFEAVGIGQSTLSLLGLIDDFNGISLYDFGSNTFLDYGIDSQLEISVGKGAKASVPEGSTTIGLLSLGLLATVCLSRKIL